MRPLLVSAMVLFACSSDPLVNPNLPGLQAIASGIDSGRMMGTVTALSDHHLADAKVDCSSFPDTAARFCQLSHDRAHDDLRQRLETLGYTVNEHVVEDGALTTRNLFADLRGTTRPDEVVLIGAHYDAFYGSADDNSTGIAAVIEIARAFSGLQFDRTVRFIGFDLEEVGLTGSTRYVQSLTGNEKIVASIVFDCIGYSSSAAHSQTSLPGLPAPDVGDFIAVIGNAHSDQRARETRALNDALGLAKMIGIVAPADGASPIAGNLMRSDHAPFWLSGREALFFTDTANFRNPNYHTATDLPATLDEAFLGQATQLAAVSAAYMAGGPR